MLTSTRSERVRSVRALTGRSTRERTGSFLAEGPQAVREAVAAGPRVVRDVYTTPDAAARHGDVVDAARDADLPVHACSDEVLAAMADTRTPQGLLAVCRLLDVPLDRLVARRPRLVAVLSHVRDPGNAGTVLRTADAAGADGVVLTDASVDVHNPKCVRATAGSIFHLDVVAGVPLDESVRDLRHAGLTVLAADAAGRDLDEMLDDARSPLSGPVAWVLGNESWGLAPEERALADDVVRVPIHGRAESLNLATAAAVCLYATARAQRRARTPGAP